MQLNIQLYLPTSPLVAVTGHLWLHVESSGLYTLGHEVLDTVTGEVLALGASPRLTHNEAQSDAQGLVAQYLRVLPSVVDAPPFE